MFKVEILRLNLKNASNIEQNSTNSSHLSKYNVCQRGAFYALLYLFHPGDLVTRMGERKIQSVYGRIPDNPGELAWMSLPAKLVLTLQQFAKIIN